MSPSFGALAPLSFPPLSVCLSVCLIGVSERSIRKHPLTSFSKALVMAAAKRNVLCFFRSCPFLPFPACLSYLSCQSPYAVKATIMQLLFCSACLSVWHYTDSPSFLPFLYLTFSNFYTVGKKERTKGKKKGLEKKRKPQHIDTHYVHTAHSRGS
ncbi:hypothetical protein K457DRAFT_270869 [Linnemannia elongata AG-77]|uniref:Uncharacterized protein n=1 Tax=Linnemannia elongata AG-77 TaxID=1314771 RepID=A0A197K577_9FUNG|nr:hypothetical protein K457DRAFT_270869 [Linnemannia elongata AG-77]